MVNDHRKVQENKIMIHTNIPTEASSLLSETLEQLNIIDIDKGTKDYDICFSSGKQRTDVIKNIRSDYYGVSLDKTKKPYSLFRQSSIWQMASFCSK